MNRDAIMARAAKASATNLAKRITKTCAACGKEWKEKPSHAFRKFCSAECAGNAIRIQDKEKICTQCGSAFKTTWKTRSNVTCSLKCAHLRHGQQQRNSGHSPIRFRDEKKWLSAVKSEENRLRASKTNAGKIRSTPKSKRFSPNHSRAVECWIRDPQNIVHYVKNIAGFVHKNPHLFPPETVIWRKSGKHGSTHDCASAGGLRSIASGRRNVWRGWMLVGNREGRERFDLVGRNLITSQPDS